MLKQQSSLSNLFYMKTGVVDISLPLHLSAIVGYYYKNSWMSDCYCNDNNIQEIKDYWESFKKLSVYVYHIYLLRLTCS